MLLISGELLASAGDGRSLTQSLLITCSLNWFFMSDNVVCLWRLGEGGGASGNIATDTTVVNKETWNVAKMLR